MLFVGTTRSGVVCVIYRCSFPFVETIARRLTELALFGHSEPVAPMAPMAPPVMIRHPELSYAALSRPRATTGLTRRYGHRATFGMLVVRSNRSRDGSFARALGCAELAPRVPLRRNPFAVHPHPADSDLVVSRTGLLTTPIRLRDVG
jgi:hypothetical protein